MGSLSAVPWEKVNRENPHLLLRTHIRDVPLLSRWAAWVLVPAVKRYNKQKLFSTTCPINAKTAVFLLSTAEGSLTHCS